MAKDVKCKNCNNYRCDWCEKVVDSPDPNMPRTCQYFWERTHADRIRAMSDEELAEFISDCGCPNHSMDCMKSCKDCTLKWLKQPVGE